MAKSKQKLEARRIRSEEGESIKFIARKLDVSVSSVSVWCRDIELTEGQLSILSQRAIDPYYGKRLDYIKNIKKKTNTKIKTLKSKGVNEIGIMSKRELFLVGSALYWCEGFKKDSQAGFANSDPAMINLFLKWLYECFNYKPSDLIPRLTLNVEYKQDTRKIEKYWADQTNIPLKYFGKPFYQNVIWKKVYKNKNEYKGVLRIKVRKSTDFLRLIHGFIDGLRNQSEVELR